jgi:hypothetical protein
VRVRARLYRYQATGQVDDKTQLTPSRELLSQHCLFSRIAAVKLEHFLCQIVPDICNLHAIEWRDPRQGGNLAAGRAPKFRQAGNKRRTQHGPDPRGE